MAFVFKYDLTGADIRLVTGVVTASAVLSIGEIVLHSSGEIDAGATGSVLFAGVSMEAVDNTADGETVQYIANPFAVYSVVDANARNAGAPLDMATGGLLVTTDSNSDLIVVETSTASEPTLVMFNQTHAFQAKA